MFFKKRADRKISIRKTANYVEVCRLGSLCRVAVSNGDTETEERLQAFFESRLFPKAVGATERLAYRRAFYTD